MLKAKVQAVLYRVHLRSIESVGGHDLLWAVVAAERSALH